MVKPKHLIVFFTGILIGLVLKLFCIDIVRISGTSMEPAIREGKQVVIWKLAYGIVKPFTPNSFVRWSNPKAGDIVSYLHNNKIVIKRCIATEKMSLSFCSNSGYYVTIHNEDAKTVIPLSEQQYQRLKMSDRVPDGYIFAIGDNYEDSIDSRDYGFVVANEITGKVLCK